MDDRTIRTLIGRVRTGRLSRRGFLQRMAAVGLAAPLANQLLAIGGVAMAQTPSASTFAPSKAGGGGTVKLLWWQAPTLLNPHFAVGTKDQDASRLFYEPMASWDVDGNLVPVLAAEIPTIENGDLGKDGKSVVWKLKPGVKWHDGEPVTADDLIFNWQYAKDPATAAVTAGSYLDIDVQKIDPLSVRVLFKDPRPFWADPFVGVIGMIIPRHVFEPYIGDKSRAAPANLAPIGTGPYLFKEFRPGDMVSGTINPNYHRPNQPFFDAIEMKGGGDAASAARAVLQTGEYDFGWNLQVEDELLKKLEAAGQGRVNVTPTGSVEYIALNTTDPNVEVDGERSSIKTAHPTFSDPAVRHAMSMLVDRESVHKYIYGRTGDATPNYINNPARFRSGTTKFEFNVDKAAAILDQAGYKPGPDGIRVKDGKRLHYLYQTSINQPRQQTQQIVKQACRKAGVDVELKAITPSVFFSSDVANSDTYPHFYADLEMYTTGPTQPDPGIFLQMFLSSQVAQKANKWQGKNITRWRNADYDRVYGQSQSELDPVKRAALLIDLNNMVVDQIVVIPVVTRPTVSAQRKTLRTQLSGYDSQVWNLAGWHTETS